MNVVKFLGKTLMAGRDRLAYQMKEHRKQAVALLMMLFAILLFLCLRMDTAFEYRIDSMDTKGALSYDLQHKVSYNQKLDIKDETMFGMSFLFDTHEQVNQGELTVTFNEDGIPIREMTSNIAYFADNVYQKFYFDTPVNIKNESVYGFTMTASYTNPEDVISIQSQSEGDGLLADGKPVEDTSLCCRMIFMFSSFKNKMLFAQIFFVILIGIILLFKLDFSSFRIGRALLITLGIMVMLENVLNRIFSEVRGEWQGRKLAWLVLDLVVLYLLVVYLYSKKKEFAVEKFFLVSAIPLMIIYLALMMPWSAPDTNRHFKAAYRQSNMLLGKEEWVIRKDDAEFFDAAFQVPGNPMIKDVETILDYKSLKAHDTELIPWSSPDRPMEYYSIFCYLPQVLGICLARILGLGSVLMVYLARLFISIVYVLGCYHAIKKAPVGKFIFAAVPLLPMSLMMGTAISYDPMVLLSTLNFLACSLKLSREPESKTTLMECMVWAFLIGAVKGGGYLIFLPLVFIFSRREKQRPFKNGGLIVLAGIVSVVLFDVVLPSGSSLFQFGEAESGALSSAYALANPIEYLHMSTDTYLLSVDSLMINMGGTALAWLEQTIPAAVITSLMLITGVYCIFEKDDIRLGQREKWVFGLIVLLECVLTPIMLMSSTVVGSTYVMGLQGRYYLPVLPLILLILTKYKLHDGAENVTEEHALEIKSSCFRVFAILSCLCIYYMLRLYLTR